MHSRSVVYSSFVFIVLGMLVVLVGCGPTDDVDADAKSEEVTLSAKDNGGQVEVDAGQTLVLTLESNPSTGFSWEVIESDVAVLRPKAEPEFKVTSELDPPPPGAGGVEIFRFEVVGAGETLLTLVYHRPWEEGVEPLETYSIQVTVR